MSATDATPTPAHSNVSLNDIVVALHVVNKRAKQLGYDVATGQDILDSSLAQKELRKDALYALKREVLAELHADAERVEQHEIRGSQFYCIYFSEYSFHVPVDEFDVDLDVCMEKTLAGFNPPHVPNEPLSLEAALCMLHEELGLNANHYLDRRSTLDETTNDFVDIGWDCLDETEAVEMDEDAGATPRL